LDISADPASTTPRKPDARVTGANDGMRYSDKELDPKVVEKRIRSLMKSPRKKPLNFGMAMFENDSCPPVSYFSVIVLHDTFALYES
jgi:hypothetical protein